MIAQTRGVWATARLSLRSCCFRNAKPLILLLSNPKPLMLLLQERLAGSSLLVFANKQVRPSATCVCIAFMIAQDLPGALSIEEVRAALGLDCIRDRHWKIQVMTAAACA